MAEDKSWIQMSRSSKEYKAGIKGFMEKARLYVNEEGKTRCPRIVESHLLTAGSNRAWVFHGESYPVANVESSDASGTNIENEEEIDEMIAVLHDIITGHHNMSCNDNNENGTMAEPAFSEDGGNFDNLFGEVESELYPGCIKFSVLTRFCEVDAC